MTENYSFPKWKKKRFKRFAKICGTASFFPEKRVTNQDIIEASGLPMTDIVIKKTLGIAERREADRGVTDSDLLAEAARQCLANAGIEADELSRIVATKFLGDRVLPMTASLVQRKIGCTRAIQCFDVDGGINSFLQAIDLATRFINTGDQYILLVSGGVTRCVTSQSDPRTAFLFGDGAAAILLGPSDRQHFMASYFYSNHDYYDHVDSYGEMTKLPRDIMTTGDFSFVHDCYKLDNWKKSADFYMQAAGVTKENLLEESSLTMDNINKVLVTENNRKMWSMTLDQLNVPEEKSLSAIEHYGNTMSAMLPILLDKGFREKQFQPEENIMLISHGEGANGGGLIYRV